MNICICIIVCFVIVSVISIASGISQKGRSCAIQRNGHIFYLCIDHLKMITLSSISNIAKDSKRHVWVYLLGLPRTKARL